MKILLAAVLAIGLGTVVATVVIGGRVAEEQVVEHPYEASLRYDADRAARAALGWSAEVDRTESRAVRFTLRDRAGRPLDGAAVAVTATRRDSSREVLRASGRPLGGGAYQADLAFAGEGTWVLALDVRRGADHLVLEREVAVARADGATGEVATGAPAGALARAAPLAGGGTVALDLGPRPLRTMADLRVEAEVRDAQGRPLDAAVSVAFAMRGMYMGENRVALAPAGPGRRAGRAVLVRCPSGRKDWTAQVTVARAGMAPATATFEFRVEE